MAESLNADQNILAKYRYKIRSEEEMQELLNNKDKKSTQRATQQAIKNLNHYLSVQKLPDVDNIPMVDLASTLVKLLCLY